MFKKAPLSFANRTVFETGFKPSIDNAFCVVSRMLFDNKINVDGSIDVQQAGRLRKYELWSYVYYLFYYNSTTVEEFSMMSDPKNGKANAFMFYTQVRKVVDNRYISEDVIRPFDVNALIYFVNVIVHKYGMDLMNPVVNYLQQLLQNTEAIEKLKTLKIVSGRSSDEIDVITDPSQIANAHIKIEVRPTD